MKFACWSGGSVVGGPNPAWHHAGVVTHWSDYNPLFETESNPLDVYVSETSSAFAWSVFYSMWWSYSQCWFCGYVRPADRIEFERVELGDRVAVDLVMGQDL